MGRLGQLLGRLGALMGRRGRLLGRLGAHWAVLGASWGLLGRLGAVLGGYWAVLERRKAEKPKMTKTSKKNNENQRFWPLRALLGGILEASWGVLGASAAV